ncbi:hypothetical protein EVAR_17132_1 [Eumeta japonica]|uniref:Uncharacterized protein n=1 Tax=Eumeta variegata TaxID=151549 RepID=A0A4C1UMM6_EUMVA|nr:hypothetical protein EVAR_17132_1 [Eumeta japonica]
MEKIITRRKVSSDARENWMVPDITWIDGVPDCGKLNMGREVEKESLITQGFGKREGTRVLTIHEAQGLTSEGTVIVRVAAKHKLHDSISHAVVAITCHTVSYVYYMDDGKNAIGRFIKWAVAAIENKIKDNNVKMAIRNMDKETDDPDF